MCVDLASPVSVHVVVGVGGEMGVISIGVAVSGDRLYGYGDPRPRGDAV